MATEARSGLEFTFTCGLTGGLHARPASALGEAAAAFASDCILVNLRSGATADLKSVLAIIGAGIQQGDECSVRVRGADESAALATLRSFIEHELPLCDAGAAEAAPLTAARELPRSLRAAVADCTFGFPVSSGIGRGVVVRAANISLPRDWAGDRPGTPAQERSRFECATATLQTKLQAVLARESCATEAAVLKAHLGIVTDLSLAKLVREKIAAGLAAGAAVAEAAEFFSAMLRQSESAYIRERVLDLQEVGLQLLAEMYGQRFRPPALALTTSSVVVANTMAPQQLLALDRKHLAALVLESEGTTSHAVILARSLGIPTLVGVGRAGDAFEDGAQVLVDANRGVLFRAGVPAVEQFYEREEKMLGRRRTLLQQRAGSRVTTTDGVALEVAANIASGAEAVTAFQNGADSVGVFRTEMLFVGRDEPPSEDEQFAAYAEAARAANGRAVLLRLLDVGGDKPVRHLNLPREANPFLGYRGVRIYGEYEPLIRTQLRAMLRASAVGRVWIMAPFIASVEELRAVKAVVASVQEELKGAAIAFDPKAPLGIMLEVPAAAFALDALCREAEFISLGTNDLAQYFFAADRTNPRVAALANVRHPSFLRLLKQIVESTKRKGKWIGMCGEMAADALNLRLLVGLGLEEISLPAAEIPVLKEKVTRLSARSCRELLEQALACDDAGQVEALLSRQAEAGAERPLIDSELVILNSDSRSKEEAIREAADALSVAGRTDAPDAIEAALWARESVYSTGLGHGFAIPHCKSSAVRAASLCVLKLRSAVEWASIDEAPVRIVIMLAMPEGDGGRQHLQVFSQLARKLMSEEFRGELAALNDAQSIVAYLSRTLQPIEH